MVDLFMREELTEKTDIWVIAVALLVDFVLLL
jgi:hypothetical protein